MAENFVLDFIEQSKACDDLTALTALLQKTLESIGFARWAYATESSLAEHVKRDIIIHNYPEDWVRNYIENRYSQIDPVIIEGKQEVTPFVWSDLFAKSHNSKEQIAYLKEAHDFDLIDGLGVPIIGLYRSYSVLSLASGGPAQEIRKEIDKNRMQLIALGLAFHCLTQPHVIEQAKKKTALILSPRERECLLWVMRGKSSWDISQIINTTERTVIFHIENAKKKLGVTSRSHAVVEAIIGGHISL